MNRFAWEAARAARKRDERRRSVLHFDRVLAVKTHGIDPRQAGRGAVAAGDPLRAGRRRRPASIELVFAGGGADPARRRMHRGAAGRPRRRLGRLVAPGAPGLSGRRWRSGSTSRDAGFEARFAALPRRPSARSPPMSTTPCARSSPTCAPRATRRCIDYTAAIRPASISTALGIAVSRGRDRRRRTAAADAEAIEALTLRARPHRARITSASGRRTTATPIRSASSSARAGRRSRRSGSTCRAARRAIRARC